MPIVTILVVLVVLGLAIWLVNTYIPMQPPFKTIFNVVAVVAVIIWLLKATGFLH